MEILEDILERELEEAFEIKDKEALHRYIKFIVASFSPRDEIIEIRADIKVLAETMKQGFENIDRRFEDINRRFEDINRRFEDINKRFEDINKRFDDVNLRFEDMSKMFRTVSWLIGIGFVIMNAMIVLFKFL